MPGFKTLNGNNLETEYLTNIEFIDRYASAQLWAWGSNGGSSSSNGRLGLTGLSSGHTFFSDDGDRRQPERVIFGSMEPYPNYYANGALESSWKKLSIGRGTTHAIKSDGSLWYWSNVTFSTINSASFATYGGGSIDVSGGTGHSAVITYSGSIVSRGNNTFGQIGDGTRTARTTLTLPITGNGSWKSVSCGSNNTLAIKTDGTLWAWGDNTYGQLGDGTAIHKSSPVQNILGGNTWSVISSGDSHALAIKTDGTLWAWGINDFGQLGDSTVIAKSSPVQIPGTTWKTVIAGVKHSAAIKNDGTLWLWGANSGNYVGLLGDGTSTNKSSPVQIISGGTWKQVACGNTHNLGIKSDGTVWGWGADANGQLATFTSTFTPKSSPVQTRLVGEGTLSGYWKQVACGDNFSMMIGFDAWR
jgi:alpha-tubulin suppressor-like RCC1 family protein